MDSPHVQSLVGLRETVACMCALLCGTWARRVGMELWGGDAPRRFFSDHHWREPVRWNAEAGRMGRRARVFCASMADVFEPRSELDPWRERLWHLIEMTPHLDWLLLTKRPGHIKHVYPWAKQPRDNVWLGTTAENQRWADRRIERLLSVEAKVRFLSCEPLLSGIELTPWLQARQIGWVIAGGESGRDARPTHHFLILKCLEGDTSAFVEGVTGVYPLQLQLAGGRKVLVMKISSNAVATKSR